MRGLNSCCCLVSHYEAKDQEHSSPSTPRTYSLLHVSLGAGFLVQQEIKAHCVIGTPRMVVR